MKKDSYLWVEKYKPTNLQECVLPNRIKNTLQEFLDSKEIKNYIAVGSPGCGKTSSAKAILNELDVDYLFINASTEGNVDTIRHKVTKFASTKSMFGGYKVIILDESDYLSHNAQAALRGTIEEFYENCRFILTANYENKIIDALKSRCPVIDFNFNESEKKEMMRQFLPRVVTILTENDITFDKKEMIDFCVSRFPDFRKVLTLLQRNSVSGELKIEYIGSDSDERVEELVNHLRNRDFDKMREWVTVNLDNEGHIVRRALYDKMMPQVLPDTIPALILILNDFDSREVQVKDLEIHMVAMCLQIMQEVQFND